MITQLITKILDLSKVEKSPIKTEKCRIGSKKQWNIQYHSGEDPIKAEFQGAAKKQAPNFTDIFSQILERLPRISTKLNTENTEPPSTP